MVQSPKLKSMMGKEKEFGAGVENRKLVVVY